MSEHCCSYHPLPGIALYDGGNDTIVVNLADSKPENPTVYFHDHADYEARNPTPSRMSLSRFLGKLEIG